MGGGGCDALSIKVLFHVVDWYIIYIVSTLSRCERERVDPIFLVQCNAVQSDRSSVWYLI